MLKTNDRTHPTHPSLLPLRMALIAAGSETPTCPPRIDRDEQLALQLIEKMKTEYAKPLPFPSLWKDDPVLNTFRLQEVIGTNA